MTIKNCFETGGSAPPATGGWQTLTAADCVDGYSSGGSDNYSGIPNLTLTDNAGAVEMRTINTVNPGADHLRLSRRISVFWHDTGIPIEDAASIEVRIQHVGHTPQAYTGNKQFYYGAVMSTTYMVPDVAAWYPLPEQYIMCWQWYDNNAVNKFASVAVNNESMAGSGQNQAVSDTSYFWFPIHNHATAGKFTMRDAYMRHLTTSFSPDTWSAARDISTFYSVSRKWSTGETVKIGIAFGGGLDFMQLPAGEGFDFKIHYRVNEGRI